MSLTLHGLRTVIYPAPDLEAAKAWWTQTLGIAPYFDQPFYVGDGILTATMCTPHGAVLGLIVNPHFQPS